MKITVLADNEVVKGLPLKRGDITVISESAGAKLVNSGYALKGSHQLEATEEPKPVKKPTKKESKLLDEN